MKNEQAFRDESVSIHAPCVGSDHRGGHTVGAGAGFNPRSLCGERRVRWNGRIQLITFQSTLPVWGATSWIQLGGLVVVISIHAPCVGSDYLHIGDDELPIISIHAPCVGSDKRSFCTVKRLCNFNPRSLCGERPKTPPPTQSDKAFQSTLPVWGATAISGTRPIMTCISIHAPCVGSDPKKFQSGPRYFNFNPRSLCGERRILSKS